MLARVVVENGVKKLVPLTADAGAGNPVGSLISMYKKSSPSGYLYCDGSTFDETEYPLLYAYLGSNVLPDYREFALVGAEQNTTDTIATHDVYAQGEGKDDQLQGHFHSPVSFYYGSTKMYINNSNAGVASGSGGAMDYTSNRNNTNSVVENPSTDGINGTPRTGNVTRGKRKAVYFYIKATSGLSENAQDDVLSVLSPVDTVTSGDMHSVTSNAVAKHIITDTFTTTVSIGAKTFITDSINNISKSGYSIINVFLYATTGGVYFEVGAFTGNLVLYRAYNDGNSTGVHTVKLLVTYMKN